MNNKSNLTLELYQIRHEKVSEKKKIYKEYYVKCLDKIRLFNRQHNTTECFFDLPIILMSYPNYKLIECTIFILYRLKRDGIQASYIYPNKLYISWNIRMNPKELSKMRKIKRSKDKENMLKTLKWKNDEDNDEDEEEDEDEDKNNKSNLINNFELPPTNSSDPFSILHTRATLLKKDNPVKKRIRKKKN